MEISEKEIELLGKEIAKKLNEDNEFQANDDTSFDVRASFKKFLNKRKKYLLNLPIEEIAYMFYSQGCSDGQKIENEVSLEYVEKIFSENEFLNNVQEWIKMKSEDVKPLPNNPIVEIVKKVIPCMECRMWLDMYCDGKSCEEIEEIEKVNLENIIKEDAKC